MGKASIRSFLTESGTTYVVVENDGKIKSIESWKNGRPGDYHFVNCTIGEVNLWNRVTIEGWCVVNQEEIRISTSAVVEIFD
jgi:hypothetical protein